MNVLGIIPARGGSKRVPRKNLRPLEGKPLVAWAIEAATGATLVDRVVVSSDDDEILDVARSYGTELVLRRPPELSTDSSAAIDYVRHALDTIETAENVRFDAVAIVQPSSPLTLPDDIDATIRLLEESGSDSAVTVMKVDHVVHPAKLKVLEADRLIPYLEDESGRMAEHELPDIYVRNCAVYVSSRATIDTGDLLGHDSRAVLMPRERSIDINEELDLAFAEFLAERAHGTGTTPDT